MTSDNATRSWLEISRKKFRTQVKILTLVFSISIMIKSENIIRLQISLSIITHHSVN